MNEFVTVEGAVYETLVNSPDTRNSDSLLYLSICKRIKPEIARMSYEEVLLNRNNLGLPNRGTVERCRRKLQAEYKQLLPSKATTERRYGRYKEALEYATE